MNYALKGHAMKRGTLMVLKRLLVTTLSALGLGALVAGTAFGQSPQPPGNGNIPAPNLFDDQIACSMNVPALMGAMAVPMPTVVPRGATSSTLDNLLRANMGMGDPRTVDLTATDDPDSGGNNPMDLIDVVPADVANCGAVAGTAAFTVADNGAIATHVAEGFTEVKAAYDDLVEQEGVVAQARMARDQARMDATATNPNTTAINSAQAILDAANAELMKRQTALDAISDGPIYQAGIAEWRARGAVETAVAAWNMAVLGVTDATGMEGALDILDAATYGGPRHQNADSAVLTGYVALGADPSGTDVGSVGNVLNADGTVNIANMRTYADVAGDGTRTTDNFNDDGSLAVPMRATLDPDDGNAMEVLPTTATIGTIRADREAANNAVAALEEAQAKNTNRNLDIAYEEAVRRARLEAAHLNAQWNAAVTDAIDLRTDAQKLRFTDTNGDGDNSPDDNETTPNPDYVDAFSLLSLNTDYQGALTKRDTAETALRMAVADREAKTRATINSFTSPGSFYQQLVDRRQALKDAASNIVNRIINAGGTPTTAQNQAVQDAQDDLDEADKVKGNYDALVGDADNPAVALVDVLATTDGDDGQALVSAITGNYDATQDNEGRLDALLTTNADGTESGRIVDIENQLGEGGNVEQIQTDLNALAGDGRTDETVKGNSDEITSLDGRVADNESDIGQIQVDLYGETSGQHGDLAACDGTGLLNVATCADARSRHNEADIVDIGTELDDVNDKLVAKKEYIENLAEEIGVDPVTGEGTGENGMSRIDMIEHTANHADEVAHRADERSMANAMEIGMDENGMSRIDHNEARSMTNAEDIAAETTARMAADDMLDGRIDAEEAARMKGDADELAARMAADDMLGGRIDAEEAARMAADDMLGGRIDAEAMYRADADMALGMRIDGEAMARADADVMLGGMIMAEEMARMEADAALGGRVSSNADAIAANMNSIGQNASAISDNRNMIGELSDDLDVVRAGVAASMALAGMPAINGRGISIGVGSYDGESAFAVGFQIQGEQASFKVGVTSSGGETGASAGVGFNF